MWSWGRYRWRSALVGGALSAVLMVSAGCGESLQPQDEGEGDEVNRLALEELPYAQEVVSFKPGPGAGFGQDRYPQVVLGPPQGKGPLAGSLDVMSLGVGGELVLSFGSRAIVDGPGVDFVVFENPFWFRGEAQQVFAELAEISVSEDGQSWHSFSCDRGLEGQYQWPGCAGWSPTLEYAGWELRTVSHELTGGDGFDLAELGLSRVRYVKIRDLAEDGQSPSAGFDLDAVGVIHYEPDAGR